MFNCEKCSKSFTRKDALFRHKRACGSTSLQNLLLCMFCISTFTRRDKLVNHYKKQHPLEPLPAKSLQPRQPTEPYSAHVPSTSKGVKRAARDDAGPEGKRQACTTRCHSCYEDIPKVCTFLFHNFSKNLVFTIP